MLTKTADGYSLAIHATPAARHNSVGGSHDSALRVSVTAVADKGEANKAIRIALAEALGMARSQISLISGTTHRRKVFALIDPPNDLAAIVARLAKNGSD